MGVGLLLVASAGLIGCDSGESARSVDGSLSGTGVPVAALPVGEGLLADPNPLPADREIADLTEPGAVARGTTEAVVIDSRSFVNQIARIEVGEDGPRRVKLHLPPHTRPGPGVDPVPALEDFEMGGLRGTATIDPGSVSSFSTLDSTGWTPPDPTLAVGPDHVVVTVNQTIGWYTKGGTEQFRQILGSQGSPGFFEPVGAGTFAFDPKCFYDHYAERFVVLALEVYSSTAYITIAVSDDDDPNGIWYKYRTDAVINVGGDTFWWDYPGWGYDEDAYYVTSNLFGLNNNGFAGAGFRVYDKSDMLTGAPVSFSTLRDGGSSSVQAAQHFGGDNNAAFFMRANGGSSLRVHTITNPLSNPTLGSSDVSVPSYSGPPDADVSGGGDLSVVGSRLMTVQYRGGSLWTAHAVSGGNAAKARWYEVDLNNWPSSGFPSLAQSGTIDLGSGVDTFFPAIYTNNAGEAAIVVGSSSTTQTVGMQVAARYPGDAAGSMGTPVVIRQSPSGGSNGRWGDYYDMALDPDGMTFWAIGQTQEPGIGWDTWVAQFALVQQSCNAADLAAPFGVLDLADIGAFVDAFQAGGAAADLAAPFGVLDLGDIQAFIAAFQDGCP